MTTTTQKPTAKKPASRLPKVELPKFEMPKVTLPKFELPKFELPKLDLAALAWPRLEQDVVAVARDAAYATLGLGVLAVQQVQSGIAAVSDQLRRSVK